MQMPNKRTTLLFALVILALGAITYSGHLQAAHDRVSWNPTAIAMEAFPGEEQEVSVSIHAKKLFAKTLCVGNAIKTVIRVSDTLASYVTALPDTVCGEYTEVNIMASVPSDAQAQLINGELRLYREISWRGRTFTLHVKLAKPLPVTLSIVTEDDGLPPDPGEAGKTTVAGIDSDGDGVRDDIQRYIAFTHPDSEKVRLALTQSAKEFQAQLLSADDKEESIRLAHEEKAGDCLDYVVGNVPEASDMDLALLAEFLNTEARSRAYVRFGQNISGQVTGGVYPWEKKTQCDFNPDETEN